MTREQILAAITDEEVVALTIWAEARREPLLGRIAVAAAIRTRVIANRAKAWGLGWRGVCLHYKQFSCWNPSETDENHLALMAEAKKLAIGIKPETNFSLRSALWVARGAMADAFEDPTSGAAHYYSPTGMVPKGSKPTWARPPAKLTVTIGRHQFWKGA